MALAPKKEKKEEKKLSLKERLAAKKAEKETPKKTEKKVEKKEKKATSKGRPAGVKYVLKEKVQESLEKLFAKYQGSFEQFEEALNSFIEKGNKAQAKKAREYIGDMYKMTKDFRKAIQEAKQTGLKQEPK